MGIVVVTAAERAGADAKTRDAGRPVCETRLPGLLPPLLTEEGMLEPPAPLPPNVEVRRAAAMAEPEDACENALTAVYCNTLGQWADGVSGTDPDLLMADDIATTAVAGCYLDSYVIMVTGDVAGDGSGVGPYDVDVALYRACPSAGGTAIRGTRFLYHDDNVIHPVPVRIRVTIDAGSNIPLPASLYLGVKFSRVTAGIVLGAPATVGFSADSFDSPHAPCRGWYGGFPANPHGSFYAEIYVRPGCPRAFVGYKNSNHARRGFSPGGDIVFADDIRLGTQECNMVAYEVTVEGTGNTEFDLRRLLTEDMIPGTDAWTSTSVAEGPTIKRVEFDEPISLPESLYIVFKASDSDVGPILTGKQADVGSSEDLYWIYDGEQWIPHSETAYSAFDVSIWCDDLPPTGACCDMILPSTCVGGDNDGDPCLTETHCIGWPCVGEVVCREVPEMNCAYPDMWEEGGTCGPVCADGDNEGQHCADDSDCPIPACVGGSNENQPCNPDADCAPDPGATCDQGTRRCWGGVPQNNKVCITDEDCQVGHCVADICEGGANNGDGCDPDVECPDGSCVAGAGTATCEGSFCIRGYNNGQACTRQADCPGGTCAGGTQVCDSDDDCGVGIWCQPAECEGQPFRRPCGQSACCTPDGPCEDLTEKQCFELEPVGLDPQRYQQGSFCGVEDQHCPRPACRGLVGLCEQERVAYCIGGDRDGLVCDPDGIPGIECEGRCAGGLDGFPCVASTCADGPRYGEPCDEDSDCGNPCWYPLNCRDDPEGSEGDCVGDCPGVPGCANALCCDQVCDHLSLCCSDHWGATCAAAVWEFCDDYYPDNDTCERVSGTGGERGHGGALLVEVPSRTESDGIHERDPPPSQPDFCCNVDGLDIPVAGTVWYKFVATETSARLSTCCSVPRSCPANFPPTGVDCSADDSIVQVFSVGDPDVGICDDWSTCSLLGQNCGDGSPCVMDDHRACGKLNPIACNDDGLGDCGCGGFPEPTRSSLCVTGLVVGHTYYVMVAGAERWEYVMEVDEWQWVEHRGAYKLDLGVACTPSVPPLHNDICEDAESITGDDVVVPFVLATGFCDDGAPCTLPGPDCSDGSDCFEQTFATFDCPSVCLHNPETMQNDVWYDWTPDSSGVATIETCGENNLSTPNTTMVVYDGCDCPAEYSLGCEAYAESPCESGSIVTIDVVKGNCYKIRVGGWAGNSAPCLGSSKPCIGNVSINVVPFDDCNWNYSPDECDISCGAPGGPCYDEPECGQSEDCDGDGVPDNEEGCEWMEGGDMDGDGDVDLSDYELFSACMTDPCGSPPCAPLYVDECCAYADLDDDGDVDLDDFAEFQRAFNSP